MSCIEKPQTPVLKWQVFTIILPRKHLSSFVYNVCTRVKCYDFASFSFPTNYINPFSFLLYSEMVYSPKSLQVPNGLLRGVCSKQSLLACYIDTCSRKIQSEIIIQIKTLLSTSVMKAGEGYRHKGEKRRSRLNCRAVFLSFTKIVHYGRRSSLRC